jgi:hypothetical protein
MTNDLDQDLRVMFSRHEADLAYLGTAPPDLGRRVRRRQMRTGLTAAAIGLTVVAVSVGVSVRAIDMRIPDPQPASPGEQQKSSEGAGTGPAGSRAETVVTIQTERVPLLRARVWGTVQSRRPSKCAKDRKVVLFRQSGLEQHPKTDEKVAERRASPRGERYMWSLTLARPDYRRQLYYARVDSTEFCKAESTRTVHVIFAGA